MHMREIINLLEAKSKVPSNELIDATVTWLNGWSTQEKRLIAQNKILAVKQEAMQFISNRNRILFRGMNCESEEMAQLISGKPISVPLHRLSSWSIHKRIAYDFNEGLVIRKKNMIQILDVSKIVSYLTNHPVNILSLSKDGYESDAIRYAWREGEIICEHSSPLIIYPEDVVCGFDPETGGDIVDINLKSTQ